jgi:hypothetical protein
MYFTDFMIGLWSQGIKLVSGRMLGIIKKPLSERFHRLYELSFNRVIKVDKVISSFGACLLFRRTLWGDLAKEWFDLLNIIHTTVLREGEIGLFGNWVKKVSLSNLFIMLYRLDSLLRVLRPLWNMED